MTGTMQPPSHLPRAQREAWETLAQEAEAAGMDPSQDIIVVPDESRKPALEALAAVGGATLGESPTGGVVVRLHSQQPSDSGQDVYTQASHRAAAKPQTFA